MNYIVIDFEFNGAFSKRHHRFFNEIIEFGAVKLDEDLNMIDTFSQLVTPQISKKLNSHVSQLTHIKMTELKESNNTFTHVMSKFKKFLGDGVLLSWGTSDILVLIENCRYFYGEETLPFLKAYCNLQSYCEDVLDYHDRSRQMGLSACAEQLGIGFDDDTLHRALTDAELTSLCFQKLYDPQVFERHMDVCDERFYQKIAFKNYNIHDLRDPNVNKKEMFFLCDKCGHRAFRRTKWRVKNKSFRAKFLCFRCRREFEGRITVKKCFDSVKMIKRIAELPDQKQKEKSKKPQKNTQNNQQNNDKQPAVE